jgi:hypothetical protein
MPRWTSRLIRRSHWRHRLAAVERPDLQRHVDTRNETAWAGGTSRII